MKRLWGSLYVGTAAVAILSSMGAKAQTFNVSGGVTVEVSRALAFGADASWVHNGNTNDTTVDASVRYRF